MGHLIETRGVYQVWDSTDRKLCQQDVEQAVGKNTQITSLSRSWLFKLGYQFALFLYKCNQLYSLGNIWAGTNKIITVQIKK